MKFLQRQLPRLSYLSAILGDRILGPSIVILALGFAVMLAPIVQSLHQEAEKGVSFARFCAHFFDIAPCNR